MLSSTLQGSLKGKRSIGDQHSFAKVELSGTSELRKLPEHDLAIGAGSLMIFWGKRPKPAVVS